MIYIITYDIYIYIFFKKIWYIYIYKYDIYIFLIIYLKNIYIKYII